MTKNKNNEVSQNEVNDADAIAKIVAKYVADANAAIDSRLNVRANIASEKSVNAKNADHFNRARSLMNDEAIATLLATSNCDATRFAKLQVYAIKKENAVLTYLHNKSAKLDDYIAEIFVSAYRQQNEAREKLFTKNDAKKALDRDYFDNRATDEEKTYLTRYHKIIADNTISAQHKTTLDALCALQILEFVSTFETRDAYRVNFDNALTKRFAEKLAIAS